MTPGGLWGSVGDRLDERVWHTTAERLSAGVWWFRLGWVPPLMQNVFLVDDGDLSLIDAGLPWDARRLRRYVGEAGYDLGDVDRVLVTHYDLDHVGSLGRLAGELDAPVYMGEHDLDVVNRDRAPPLVHHKGAFHRALRRVYPVLDGTNVDLRPVADGDDVGGFAAYHTPGHNPGHVVYHSESVDAAFLGDLVWEDGGELTTPVRLDSYDMIELADSVLDLAERVPPFELACMGHGRPLTGGGHEALLALAGRL